MKKKISWLLNLCVLTLGLASQPSIAALITLNAEGSLGGVPSELLPYFSRGDRVIYELVFDTETPPDSQIVGFASSFKSSVSLFSVTIGEFNAMASSVTELTVWNNSDIRVNARISDGLTSSELGSFIVERLAFQLFDSDAKWLDSISIPTHYPSPSEYENHIFRVDFDSSNNLYLTGELDSFNVSYEVPEPSTLSILLLFLSFLYLRLIRKRFIN
ncbi:hypothetical protein tinsulaeT_26610 [Thalassotalea insulae]|uniref:PEP-CTERM protein-sorting domain-containing protein n=1 Tax=Thalassotalea insulae TaxID=2056778 RepID=A0ABQ6GXF7_9GAMM|nr:hypothetical protein [Thalassotalea insulae]GLX79321.1 hypothetical protein tinsulaeT_26610 [Thalassotalea insulae]